MSAGRSSPHPASNGEPWWIAAIKAFIIINLVLVTFAYLTLAERKVMGRMQLRYGPNRVGPYGLLQPIADLVKLIRKESFFPAAAVDVLYIFSPFLAAFTALCTFSVIPFGPGWEIGGYQVNGYVADLPIALILIFAIGSLGIYGFILGGWSSDSKYALLGSMRTCAQLVSYEVSLALSVLGVIIMARSLSLVDIVVGPGERGLVRDAPVRRLRHLPARRHGRDGARAVRPARGGAGARRGLPHRVRRHALRALHDVRVHQPDHALGPVRDALPRRLARAVVPGAALVPAQALHPAVRLHLGADDGAAPPLRPADALRLEGAAPGCDAERRRDGDPGGAGSDAAAVLHPEGLRRHLPADLPEADHAAVPGVQARRVPALPRPAHAAPARERAREVRRLLALRRGVPVRLHPRRRGREHAPTTASRPASATPASTRST